MQAVLGKNTLFIIVLFFLTACGSKQVDLDNSYDESITDEELDSENSEFDEDNIQENEVFLEEESLDEYPLSFEDNDIEIENDAAYKYEYRAGVSGDYTYNYDISGQDFNGDLVEGNIDINGQYGDGSIIDSEGNTRLIDVEWINHGVLEVTDEDGNTYEMEVQ